MSTFAVCPKCSVSHLLLWDVAASNWADDAQIHNPNEFQHHLLFYITVNTSMQMLLAMLL